MKRFYSFLLLLGFIGLGAKNAQAKTAWEVSVIFLGSQENEAYQKDMDRNILELSRSQPNENYRLSIYREFKDRNVEYFVDPKSETLAPWDDLFAVKPPTSIRVPGKLRSWKKREGENSIVAEPVQFARFSEEAYQNPNAKRILVVYSHGQAFDGLGGKISLKTLRESLEGYLPKRAGRPLDILWLDACFMANIEVAYELRNTSKLLVASEEAEFSAGAPFEMFRHLSFGPDSTYSVAASFLEHFIESYSYIKKGSQSDAVFKSSATLSVIDLRRIEKTVEDMKQLVLALGELSDEARSLLRKKTKGHQMDRGDATDLGQLLILLSKEPQFNKPEIQSVVEKLRYQLDVGRPERFQTNPRIMVDALPTEQSMVYGYENWKKGYKGDKDSLERLPEALNTGINRFVRGAENKEWPAIKVSELFYFSPFSVSLNKFHYYNINDQSGTATSKTKSLERVKDFVFFRYEQVTNPILLSGYTQGVGEWAERYTGISILSPGAGLPGFDYADLDFHTQTGWGNL